MASTTTTTTTAVESHQAPVLKKRKLVDNGDQLRISGETPSYIELRTRKISSSDENSVSDHDGVSCCSSNRSSVDLEVVIEGEAAIYYSCREEERNDSPMSELGAESHETMTSTAEADSCSGKSTTAAVEKKTNMPSQLEIEVFFTKAEKQIQQKIIEKYNFDIVEDQPLEGRYEWVKLSP